MKRELLPPRALKGVRVGISVSGSADLDRLGLLESHLRLALGEIARCVLLSGGQIAYGGHLDPGGYTAFLVQELHRYGRRDRPLHVCLAWQEHRKLSVGEIDAQKKSLGLYGDITCLDVDGRPIDPVANRSKDPVPELDESVRSRSLTSLRLYMARKTSARIFIGGRRKGFEGNMPGLVEEAIVALKAGQPVYLVGGFGGVTLDILRVLGVDDGSWLPERAGTYLPDPRLAESLDVLRDVGNQRSWTEPKNGLSEDENRKLAATHRPSEIGVLISLGLGRLFSTFS